MSGINSRLRRKLVVAIMVAVALAMTMIFAAMNAMNYVQTAKRADEMIALIAENNGTVPDYDNEERFVNKVPDQLNIESPYQTRFFIVQYDKSQRILDINLSHIAAISYEDAARYAGSVLNSKMQSGYRGVYRYRVQETDFGQIVIFLDCSISLQLTTSMIITSCIIALIALIAIFIVICVFSTRFIRPMIESVEKQKRFVTDAGHELKTPLAIINAQVEVLELVEGSNEWLDSIKNQVGRLDRLIKSMLQLAKMEESAEFKEAEIFNITELFEEVTESFEVLAKQKGKHLRINAQRNMKMSGDKEAIRNLISILMDNSIKYCTDDGRIEARLSQEGRNIKIRVKNTCDRSDGEDLQRLFDRFYRPDTSRSRESGGFGIGLSMAKNIVEVHHGKINAQRDGEFVCFTVTFKTYTESVKKLIPKGNKKTSSES